MNKPLFEIEKIIAKKYIRGKKYYFVKWKGYSSDENTWEPEKNFSQAKELVKAFEHQAKNNPDRKTKSPRKSIKLSKLLKKAPLLKETSKKISKEKLEIPLRITEKKKFRESKFLRRKWALKKIKEIPGDFKTAIPKKIISHILTNDKGDDQKEKLKKMVFEIEWENVAGSEKVIKPSFKSINEVKEHCPLFLCEYYEKFLDFK